MQKSRFVDIFFSFNPNRVMGINGGYIPAICRAYFIIFVAVRQSASEQFTGM